MSRSSGAYLIAAVASTILPCALAALCVSRAGQAGDATVEARYTIHGALDPADSTITTEQTVLWTNPGPGPVERVCFHLYLEAFRNEHTLYRTGGTEAGVSYEGWGGIDLSNVEVGGRVVEPERTGTWACVALSAPLPEKAAVEIRIEFTSHLPPLAERTGCVEGFCFAGQWYPKVMRRQDDGSWPLEAYHHNAEYDAVTALHRVHIEAPEGWTVAATGGARKDGQVKDGLQAWRFGGPIKDVAFAAGTDLEILTGQDRQQHVVLEVAHPRAKRDDAERTLEILRAALPVMEKAYGPFPYPVLTTVIVPEKGRGAGGMEYPGLITTHGMDPRWSPVSWNDHVLYHELMHQVFFGMLDTDEAREPWIDEGLTTYSGLRVQAAVQGGDVPFSARLGRFRMDMFENVRGALVLDEIWPSARLAARDYPSHDEYGAAVYLRTALVMETARRVWGSQVIAEALGGLAREMRGSRITGQDVERHFATAYGEEFLAGYLDPAMDSEMPLDVSVVSIGDEVELERQGEVTVPVEVEVSLASGGVEILRWQGSGTRALLAAEGGEVVSALVDPSGKLLLDANRLNNGLSSRDVPVPGRPLSLLGLATLVTQIASAVLMP